MQNKKEKSVMDYESVLPKDFDGVFKFSNPSTEDFVGVWSKKEYLFPAGTMTVLMIPEHSPLEVQHIRKKFARDLAEREYYKSKQYEHARSREGTRSKNGMIQPTGQGMSHAGAYTLKDLEPYIQKCLEPLPLSELTSKPATVRTVEDNLTRNDQGNFNTEAIDRNTSLRAKALNQ